MPLRTRIVTWLDDKSRPARNRSAVGTLFLNSVSPWDAFVSRLYFNAGSKDWAAIQHGPDHTAPVVEGLKAMPFKPTRILELGCGAGGGAAEAAKLFPDATIVGIDFAKRMIDRANELHASDKVRFEVATVEGYSGDFDLVMWLNCQAYPPSLRRFLKPGGAVLNAGTFQGRTSALVEEHFKSFGFSLLSWANVGAGFYELYRVDDVDEATAKVFDPRHRP